MASKLELWGWNMMLPKRWQFLKFNGWNSKVNCIWQESSKSPNFLVSKWFCLGGGLLSTVRPTISAPVSVHIASKSILRRRRLCSNCRSQRLAYFSIPISAYICSFLCSPNLYLTCCKLIPSYFHLCSWFRPRLANRLKVSCFYTILGWRLLKRCPEFSQHQKTIWKANALVVRHPTRPA